MTADEGWSGAPTYAPGTSNRPSTVSMYRIPAAPATALTQINTINYPLNSDPQKLDYGTVAGAPRVFVCSATGQPGRPLLPSASWR